MWQLKGNEKNQEQLDSYVRKLKFKKSNDDALKKKTITLSSVIWRIIFKQEPTYYCIDNNSQQLQCNTSRLRSVEDIYSVAKNYVKDVTREKVEISMEKLISAGLITQSYCSTILRRVHTPQNLKTTLQEVKDVLKEDKIKKKQKQ